MTSLSGKGLLATGAHWVERDALIRELSERIVQAKTATASLLDWCEEHGLSDGPIIARRLQDDRTLSARDLSLPALGAMSEELIRHRRVELARGDLPLVTADNWFLPSRLSAQMNEALDGTDLPFGAVIAPLDPARRNFAIHFNDPGDGEAWGPDTILEHQAVVIDGKGRPLAVVRERFQAALISFSSRP
ncbi:hypothetical protein [Microvirga terricola]|uniref:Uncharacterized protein n=1 Tax=Microvirga terricola TaxID=2719797 RepID=A0ABX0VG79_9HYPH|nr:hypothetical protein [Microvirga terricola]NIX77022.1 hypothetical protein [Microvirga terricola]